MSTDRSKSLAKSFEKLVIKAGILSPEEMDQNRDQLGDFRCIYCHRQVHTYKPVILNVWFPIEAPICGHENCKRVATVQLKYRWGRPYKSKFCSETYGTILSCAEHAGETLLEHEMKQVAGLEERITRDHFNKTERVGRKRKR